VIRNYVRDEFSKNIEKQFGKPDVIVEKATGATGIGMLVESMAYCLYNA
jgi:orotate phosphoribosyltransferase